MPPTSADPTRVSTRPDRSVRIWAARAGVLAAAVFGMMWCTAAAGASSDPGPVPPGVVGSTAQHAAAASGATEAAAPVLSAVVTPVDAPIAETVAPVLDSASPAVARVAEPLTPVVAPIAPAVAPVVAPIVEPVAQVIEPVLEPAEPTLDAVLDPVSPVLDAVVPPDVLPTDAAPTDTDPLARTSPTPPTPGSEVTPTDAVDGTVPNASLGSPSNPSDDARSESTLQASDRPISDTALPALPGDGGRANTSPPAGLAAASSGGQGSMACAFPEDTPNAPRRHVLGSLMHAEHLASAPAPEPPVAPD